MEVLMEYMAKGFIIMLSISMPCVLAAAGIGLIVGILQAVTQVQEQTIAAAPKILIVFMVILIGGVGFTRILSNLLLEGTSLAFNVIPKNSSYALPSDYYKYTTPFGREMSENTDRKSKHKDVVKTTGFGFGSPAKKSQTGKYQKAPQNLLPQPDFMERQKIRGQ